MVKRFEFKDNKLKLDIAGNIFELDTANPELIKEYWIFQRKHKKKLRNYLVKKIM